MKNLPGIYRHNERKNTNYSNKDINKNNFINNYSIKLPYSTYEKIFNDIKKKYNLKGQIKIVSNIMCEFIITSDKTFFDNIGKEETKRYFQTAYDFVAQYQNLGEQYIISAKVHMDESTPHMHIVFIPVVHTKDKKGNSIDKIACSEYWKGKDSYRKLQDSFYKYITDNGFDLERGKSRNVEHLSTEKLKQITNYDNIKYEIEQQNKIQQVETKNKTLILSQNLKLIRYTKKLKKQLSQAYIAIQQAEKLENENIELKEENKNLKNELSKIKSYLETTFEYVSILFDFPMKTIKKLINSFINKKNNDTNKKER